MVEQAVLADQLGFRAVSIPEHHLVNILLVPAPLQMAVKIAALTRNVEIMTSIIVLPIHDMRIFAGEAIQAELLCEGRLVVGVGRESGRESWWERVWQHAVISEVAVVLTKK